MADPVAASARGLVPPEVNGRAEADGEAVSGLVALVGEVGASAALEPASNWMPKTSEPTVSVWV